MGHGHGHGVGDKDPVSASGAHLTRLWIAVGLGCATLITQVVVGLSTSSLALLSDSAHVFTDVFGILMAVVAISLARRGSARSDRTFGLYRAEVFAALFNAILLFAVAGWILYEAAQRISDPPEVAGVPVMAVATFGLLMNIAAFLLLRSGAKESLNVRGAYLEVMADMLGSVGVLISGLVTVLFGWRYADPVIGVAIGLFVLPRAYSLGRSALRILLQHAPARLDIDEVTAALAAVDGVQDVHDLHVWTLTSGMEVASTHMAVHDGVEPAAVLARAREILADRYGLEHATIQVEPVQGQGRCSELSW
ncbi:MULTISPECIES: cation diffusion facilitator family transporter [unclassified Rhodococcus (in: high G+C Gram-positive bacteria)]|uniref:cation diffusion facilitator family transporter n=1 Tax=unclassified Rhodococcus (in: high G+C Gram-positive bacteria) TaxID=192944 RepID=UPI001C9AFB31|nr:MULTISPECIES: cation diffusion facilitator family transporter [unclassified Rhodococcus (in: high G+C Gram-positive bacteria)]MBY6709153.1 cation transporter [Rhodococcus sp. BP-241]